MGNEKAPSSPLSLIRYNNDHNTINHRMPNKDKYAGLTLGEVCAGVTKKKTPVGKKLLIAVGIVGIVVGGIILGLFILPNIGF